MGKTVKIDTTLYGIAEVLHWCHDRNKGRISGDYFTLDQFWKKKVALELTEEEVALIDRCLYDIPNLDNEPLPQIRHKFWPQQVAAH